LFAGIGGFDLALREWVRTVVYCEIEPYQQTVLLRNMRLGKLDRAPIWSDVRTLRGGRCQRLTLSSAASHAKTFPLLMKMQKVLMETEAAFSLKSRDWLLKLDLKSFSWKTRQCSLLEDSTESVQSFPAWGTVVDLVLSQPPKLAPTTIENESTYWPTPTASDWKRWNQTKPSRNGLTITVWFYQKFQKKISLNAIEKMMGFPYRWAQLDHTEMQLFQWLRKPPSKNSSELEPKC
jgi:hypothetical protein